jgi:hypothetical protein
MVIGLWPMQVDETPISYQMMVLAETIWTGKENPYLQQITVPLRTNLRPFQDTRGPIDSSWYPQEIIPYPEL